LVSKCYTQVIAKFSAELQYEDLPGDVVREVKRLLLDTIGCGLGALGLDKGRMAVELVQRMGGRPESTVLAAAKSCPAPWPHSPMAS
jgi:2-methylcitrate dehydratase PrpD